MMYVVVILETESDFPGIDVVYGPYSSYAEARLVQEEVRANMPDRVEHIQVSMVEER